MGNGGIVRPCRFQSVAVAADITCMTGPRCPACGAATPEGVLWCSLCFTDLRPEAAADVSAATPEPPPVAPEPVPGPGVDARPDPLTAPISTLLGSLPPAAAAPAFTETAAAPDPAVPAVPELPGVVTVDAELDPSAGAASWPCLRCGTAVDLSLDGCPECGAGFLAGALPAATLSLPLVGNVAAMSPAQRFGLAAGLTVGLVVIFLALATIGGAVL